MKFYLLLISIFLFIQISVNAQIIRERSKTPVFFRVTSHDPNIKELPAKSFYESKADWQYIIDTTWGPGLPLQNKQEIFNQYADALCEEFDGFESLNFTQSTWDSLRNHYYTKIDSNTSKGRFSAIMYHFTRQLSDLHTWAYDIEVVATPLNPGIPLLVVGAFCNIEHFGAVLSALEDSTIFVLRAVNNHPLSLEPGDIILGYNGELWLDIIQELLEVELPCSGAGSTKNGGTTSSQSSIVSNLLICAGMNWHLFDTIDIVKHNTGDTLHLSVSPLLNLNLSPMRNNEQLEIINIPFPDYYNDQAVTYGVLPNTNIGFIYVCSEAIPTFASADQQFNSAVLALKDVDALIIDMRWNEGGNAFWQDSFGFWTNEIIYTLEWAFRCNPTDFMLCFDGDTLFASLQGKPPGKYQRPIAVLLGPLCKSMGDINAYRLSYLDNVKTFGKPTAAGLGYNTLVQGYQGFNLRWSTADIAHISDPSYMLNRKEFPVDFPVWHNRDDVAQGKDAVVEAALNWINNLVYGHDVQTSNGYYSPGYDSVNVWAIVENPNTSNTTARIFIRNLENTFIDSVDLSPTKSSDVWHGSWPVPASQDFYKLDIKVTNNDNGESFGLTNVNRFTTAGPVVLDSIQCTKVSLPPRSYKIKPFIRNLSDTATLMDITSELTCDDPWIEKIIIPECDYPGMPPGVTVGAIKLASVQYIDSLFPGYFNFKIKLKCNGWTYWTDSIKVIVGVDEATQLALEYRLEQNYPNPFNPSTKIKYSVPELSDIVIKIFDVLGNEIETLVSQEKPAGTYEVAWNAANLTSGVYFCQLRSGSFVECRKMIFLK